MNIFKKALLISTLVISSSTFAHSNGYGKVSANKALQFAQTSTKMFTLKYHCMSVGKIDKSGGDVNKEQFRLVKKVSLIISSRQ